MGDRDLKMRTRQFALDVIVLVESLPPGFTNDVVGKQLLRSGTSVGANYRAASRARSTAEFIARLGIVEEELHECLYWMEILRARGLPDPNLSMVSSEADELLRITVTSIKTARRNRS